MLRYLLQILTAVSVVLLACEAANAQSYPGRQIDDSKLTQVVIIGQLDCAPARWFREHPGLIEASKLMHVQTITPESQMYKQRYASVIKGQPPMVLWQRSDGGVIYAAAGSSLPTSGQGLFDEMQEAWKLASNARSQQAQDCPDCDGDSCRVPVLQPWQDGTPAPFQVEVKTGLLSRGFTWLLIFGFCLVGLVILGIGSVLLLVVLYFASKLVRFGKYV